MGLESFGYTKGSLCECRHTHMNHFDSEYDTSCTKCKCKEFRYTKNWKKGSGNNDCAKVEDEA